MMKEGKYLQCPYVHMYVHMCVHEYHVVCLCVCLNVGGGFDSSSVAGN